LVGVAALVKINLLIGAGLVVLLAGIGTAGASLLTVPTLAAVCVIAAVGLFLVGVSQ
jgi:flagellar basal body P-ring protein FlgI